jgi:hypothetical protein
MISLNVQFLLYAAYDRTSRGDYSMQRMTGLLTVFTLCSVWQDFSRCLLYAAYEYDRTCHGFTLWSVWQDFSRWRNTTNPHWDVFNNVFGSEPLFHINFLLIRDYFFLLILAYGTIKNYEYFDVVDQWYSNCFFAYTKMLFLFNFAPPKFLLYNSIFTQSIIYIQNKFKKLHPK